MMEKYPRISDITVRTRSTETVCPLLSKDQRDPQLVEAQVRTLVTALPGVMDVKRVTMHYINTSLLCAEVLVKVDNVMSVKAAQGLAKRVQDMIRSKVDEMMQVIIDYIYSFCSSNKCRSGCIF